MPSSAGVLFDGMGQSFAAGEGEQPTGTEPGMRNGPAHGPHELRFLEPPQEAKYDGSQPTERDHHKIGRNYVISLQT